MDRWDISALPDYGPFMDKVKAARDNFGPEVEHARTGRRGHIQSGDGPERPHALSRRFRRPPLCPAAPIARRRPDDEDGQEDVQAVTCTAQSAKIRCRQPDAADESDDRGCSASACP